MTPTVAEAAQYINTGKILPHIFNRSNSYDSIASMSSLAPSDSASNQRAISYESIGPSSGSSTSQNSVILRPPQSTVNQGGNFVLPSLDYGDSQRSRAKRRATSSLGDRSTIVQSNVSSLNDYYNGINKSILPADAINQSFGIHNESRNKIAARDANYTLSNMAMGFAPRDLGFEGSANSRQLRGVSANSGNVIDLTRRMFFERANSGDREERREQKGQAYRTMQNQVKYQTRKMIGDAPEVIIDDNPQPGVTYNQTTIQQAPDWKAVLAGGAMGFARGAAQLGLRYAAHRSPIFRKVVGDAPERAPIDRVVVHYDHPDAKKIVGDAPALYDEPAVKKVVGDAPAIDSSEAAAMDTTVAAARLSGIFSQTQALMLMYESEQITSFSGTAASLSDLLTNIITQLDELHAVYGQEDVSNMNVMPGCAMLPVTMSISPGAIRDNNRDLRWWNSRLPTWMIDFVSPEECVPLGTTFSMDSLVAAVKTGANLTAFSSTLRLNVSFFSSDMLTRFFSMVLRDLTQRTGYAFCETLMRMVLDVMTMYPVPGDEYTQWWNGLASSLSSPDWQIPLQTAFPFARDNSGLIECRMCGYDLFVKEVCGMSDSPWTPAFTVNNWWPNSRDEDTAVAIVFVTLEELGNPAMIIRRMFNHMQYPYVLRTFSVKHYVYNYAEATYVPAQGWWTDVGDRFDPPYYQVANAVRVPGPYKKCLFVVTDMNTSNNLNLKYVIDPANPGTTFTVGCDFNTPLVTRNNQAQGGVNFNTCAVFIPHLNTDVGRHAWEAATCAEIRAWEEVYGHASARATVLRIAKSFSCVWGHPKIALTKGWNDDQNLMVGAYMFGEWWAPPRPWNVPSMIIKSTDRVLCDRVHSIIEDCYGNPAQGMDNAAIINKDNYSSWYSVRPLEANFRIGNRSIVMDFLVMRGWVTIMEEYSTNSLASGMPGLCLSLREQGLMCAATTDNLRQISGCTYPNKYLIYDRFQGDPGPLNIGGQCDTWMDNYVRPALSEMFVSGIQFNAPFWNQKMPPPVTTRAVVAALYNAEFARRSIAFCVRVNSFVAGRYNSNINFTDSILTFKDEPIVRGQYGFYGRDNTKSAFYDLVMSFEFSSLRHNIMLRKLTMGFFPESTNDNQRVYLYLVRWNYVLQLPFHFENPGSGLNFAIAYAPFFNNVYKSKGASFRSLPMGYEPFPMCVSEASKVLVGFVASAFLDALYSQTLAYRVVIAPATVTAFIGNVVPPSDIESEYFRPFPNMLGSA
nr:TPA_asm: hypothetical protein [Schmimed tricladivirus]